MEEHDRCTVCGGLDLVLKYRVKGFTLVECRHCSLVFVREKLTQQELNAYL